MSFNCPIAPTSTGSISPLRMTSLPGGTTLFRFHKNVFEPDSFNPNSGRRIDLPEDGARFNPFPGAPASNVPTLYAASSLAAAALESVFHDVEHVPSPKYARSRLNDWSYSKLKTTRDLLLFDLVNPRLRQLEVPGRTISITETELVHTSPSEYPHTRTWAQLLHSAIPNLDGLLWRPRLGGRGHSFVVFGDRCRSEDLKVQSTPISVATGRGLAQVSRIATSASILIVDP
jgi:hypothetical protein